MASYTLSALAGAGAQFFDNNGNVLSGGKVYTYAAGTTTPAATYTSNLGSAANSNPIILDSAGRPPQEIWFPIGTTFKFVVKTSTDTLIGTYDNIPSINDPYSEGSLLSNVTGTNAIAATASPTITAYATGAAYSFIAANTNTGAVTLSIDGLTAKSMTKAGSNALVAGDIQAGMLVYVHYDGTRFQLLNNVVYGGSVTNATIAGATITGGSVSGLATDLAIADGGTGASTALAAFDALKQSATSSYIGAVQLATNAEVIAGTDATKVLTPASFRAGNIVSGTAAASTSGTTVTLTGVPSWAKRVTLMLSAVSTNGTSQLRFRLGNSGGIVTSGYMSAGTYVSTGVVATADTAGFGTGAGGQVAGSTISGIMTFTLIANNTWVGSGQFASSSGSVDLYLSAGTVDVSSAMTQVQVTTINGTDTFDGGTVNILWE